MKRLIATILVLAFTIAIFSTMAVNATYETQQPENGFRVRIRYAANGKYFDVPAEGIDDNGTQLQVWEYAYGNQNQIFYLEDTGEGWKIISHMSDKVIEVRNSSHKDYAEVAQWDNHDLACARWDIISNNDGTVSFRNKESKLYLNVQGGGDARNGTKIIQYHDDGTIAMRFYLEVMTDDDVLSATFIRNIKASEIEWSKNATFSNRIINQTGIQLFSGLDNMYYPTPGQDLIFASAEYLSPNTVANLLRDKSYNVSTWNQIKDALAGELSEDTISELLSKLGFSVPKLGYALGILQVLWDSRDAKEWNRFVDAAKIDEYGCCSGVIVYTYYNIARNSYLAEANNTTVAKMIRHHIVKVPRTEYETWTGDNFSEVRILHGREIYFGEWAYHFK